MGTQIEISIGNLPISPRATDRSFKKYIATHTIIPKII